MYLPVVLGLSLGYCHSDMTRRLHPNFTHSSRMQGSTTWSKTTHWRFFLPIACRAHGMAAQYGRFFKCDSDNQIREWSASQNVSQLSTTGTNTTLKRPTQRFKKYLISGWWYQSWDQGRAVVWGWIQSSMAFSWLLLHATHHLWLKQEFCHLSYDFHSEINLNNTSLTSSYLTPDNHSP